MIEGVCDVSIDIGNISVFNELHLVCNVSDQVDPDAKEEVTMQEGKVQSSRNHENKATQGSGPRFRPTLRAETSPLPQ